MNENTMIAVCGYAGDAHQILQNMPLYKHHECPITILSPEDSKIVFNDPSLNYRFGGKRAYIGYDSLERQWIHLGKLLEFPQQFFLVNDSDSFCLSPKIPDYVYREPMVVWSNVVSDEFHPRDAKYPLPRLAFQPPYFLSRAVIERFLETVRKVQHWIPNERTPFIDHFMMHVTVLSALPYKGFPDGISGCTRNLESRALLSGAIRESGKIFIHSVKLQEVTDLFMRDRAQYVAKHGGVV